MPHFSPIVFYAWFALVVILMILRGVQQSRRKADRDRERQERGNRRFERPADRTVSVATNARVVATGASAPEAARAETVEVVPEEEQPATPPARQLRTRADLIAAGALIPADDWCSDADANDFMS